MYIYKQNILIYGLEAATLTRSANSHLLTTEMMFLSSCLQNIRRFRIRNEDIRKQPGLEMSLIKILELKDCDDMVI